MQIRVLKCEKPHPIVTSSLLFAFCTDPVVTMREKENMYKKESSTLHLDHLGRLGAANAVIRVLAFELPEAASICHW